MDDLISRQDAIDALTHKWDGMVTSVFDVLKEMPSAEPERKKGKWIIQDNPGTGWFRVMCSECGEDVTSEIPVIGFFPNCKALWDYCPYCGSHNGGENE